MSLGEEMFAGMATLYGKGVDTERVISEQAYAAAGLLDGVHDYSNETLEKCGLGWRFRQRPSKYDAADVEITRVFFYNAAGKLIGSMPTSILTDGFINALEQEIAALAEIEYEEARP